MGSPFDLAHFDKIGSQAREYFFQHVLSWAMAAQLAVIGGALLLAHKASGALRAWLTRQQTQYATHPEAGADLAILLDFVKVIDAFLAFILVAIALGIADHFSWPRNELYAAGIILIALTMVRLFTDEMQNRFWARILAIAIWFLASLYVFHLNDPWLRFLQGVDFQLGQVHFSLLHNSASLFPVVGPLLGVKQTANISPFLADNKIRFGSCSQNLVVQAQQHFSLFRLCRNSLALPGA